MPPTQNSLSPPLEQSLKASPKLSRTDLEYLREWLSKQPHLPQLTETEIVPFLHSNEYSLEKTKVCIDKYFTMRTHAPELFMHFDLRKEEVQRLHSLIYYLVLPKKDSHGNRIICTTLRDRDPTHFSFEIHTSLVYAYLDMQIREDPTCEGFVFIADAAPSTFGHAAKVNISSMSKSVAYFQEALPLRMRAIHIINVNAVAEAIFTIAKPFIGQELQQMLHFHSGKMEKFYEEFPRDILPKELGGTHGSLEDYHEPEYKKVEDRLDWFLEHSRKVVDESKRPGQAKSAGDVFGLEGSFKKLDID